MPRQSTFEADVVRTRRKEKKDLLIVCTSCNLTLSFSIRDFVITPCCPFITSIERQLLPKRTRTSTARKQKDLLKTPSLPLSYSRFPSPTPAYPKYLPICHFSVWRATPDSFVQLPVKHRHLPLDPSSFPFPISPVPSSISKLTSYNPRQAQSPLQTSLHSAHSHTPLTQNTAATPHSLQTVHYPLSHSPD